MSEETDKAKEAMDKTIENLKHEFASLRTGRPSPAVLDNIKVDYYGTATPISQVAAIKVPEGNLMTIEPWDKSIVNAIEKAIMASSLGITPSNNGSGLIRLPFPAPTEERRKEIVKECKATAERARVGIRNARKDARTKLERAKKDSEITEDDLRVEEDKLQKLTDEYVKKVDALLSEKEEEVMEN
jgi:ribosome recycling factor